MRRSVPHFRFALVLAVATTGGAACRSELPTQAVVDSVDSKPASFALSEASAAAFADALNDVRVRILPTLSANDAPLAQPLSELTDAIAARDRRAVRRALARLGDAIASLERNDAAEIASELDAVRRIMEQARPLTDNATPFTTR